METEDLTIDFVPEQTPFCLPEESQLTELFTQRLISTIQRLKLHKKMTALISVSVKKLMKFLDSVPELEPITLYPEEAAKQLSTVLAELARTIDEDFSPNDFFAFFNYSERGMTFKGKSGYISLNLVQFAAVVSEFGRLIDHVFAFEAFAHLDLQLSEEMRLPKVMTKIKYNGLTFRIYWKIKAIVQRLIELKGLELARETLKSLNILDYFEENFALKWLRKLTGAMPAYQKDGNTYMFHWAKDHDAFKPMVDNLSPNLKAIAGLELFDVTKLLHRIEHNESPPLRTTENVPPEVLQIADQNPNDVAILIACNAFESAEFQAAMLNQLSMSLRLSTMATLTGSETLDMYSPIYPLKRLQMVNLRKANCHLLYQLVKRQPTDDFSVVLENLRTRGKFKKFLNEFFKQGFYLEESDLVSLPEELRRLNRKFNKIFTKAFEIVVTKLLEMYCGFFFDQGIRRYYLSKTVRAVEKMSRVLSVLPEWRSVRPSETKNKDQILGTYDRMSSIIVEIRKEGGKKWVLFSFWKGMKLYESQRYEILRVDSEARTIELGSDLLISGLINDFRPSSIVIVADCPESFLLRLKVATYVQVCTLEGKSGEKHEPMITYFLHAPLLDALAENADKSVWSRGMVYNCFLQNPLLTFLTIFRKEFSQGKLFSPQKVDLRQDLTIFLIKLAVLESIFEKGISISDILASAHCKPFLELIGSKVGRDELMEIWAQKKTDSQVGVFVYNFTGRLAWYRFNKVNAIHPALTFFQKTPSGEHYFISMKTTIEKSKSDRIRALNDAVKEFFDPANYQKPTELGSQIRQLEPRADFLTNALYVRRIMVELRYAKNTKVDSLWGLTRTDDYELATAQKLFKGIILLERHVVVTMRVTDIDTNFVMGRVAGFFQGCLHYNDIGSIPFSESKPALDKYFSKNEVIKVVINKAQPSILRLEVSWSNRSLAMIHNYIKESKILEKFGLREGIGFMIDPNRDFPTVEEFEKVERNFDYFLAENEHLRNWSLADCKTKLRETQANQFVFKPAQRNKPVFMDLVLYFVKIDTLFVVPVYQVVYDASGVAKRNEKPAKYDKTDFEDLILSAMSTEIHGFSAFVDNFVQPLLKNVQNVIDSPKFLSISAELIAEKLKSAEGIVLENTPGEANYYITRNPAADLQFLLYYRDSKGVVGSKTLQVTHKEFELLDKFASFEELIENFKQNWKEDKFLNPVEGKSNANFMSIDDDSTSVLSVSIREDSPFVFGKAFLKNKARSEMKAGSEEASRGFGNEGFQGRRGPPGGFDNSQGERRPFRSGPGNFGGEFRGDRPPFNGRQNRPNRDQGDGNNAPSWGNTAGGDSAPKADAPSWGQAAPTTSDVPSWGEAPKAAEQEAPSWGAPQSDTKPTETAAPGWGAPPAAPAESTPGWGAPPAEPTTQAPAQSNTSGGWGGSSAPQGGASFGEQGHQNRPPRFNNDGPQGGFHPRNDRFGPGGEGGGGFQPRPRFGDGQGGGFNRENRFGGNQGGDRGGGFNRGGPRPPRDFSQNQGGNSGGSWGGNAGQKSNAPSWGNNAADSKPADVPSWGAPAETKAPDVPSWGAPAEAKPAEVPSWGAPAEAKPAEAPTWGSAVETASTTPVVGGWGAPPADPSPPANTISNDAIVAKTDGQGAAPGWGAPPSNNSGDQPKSWSSGPQSNQDGRQGGGFRGEGRPGFGNRPPREGGFNRFGGDRQNNDQGNRGGWNQGAPGGGFQGERRNFGDRPPNRFGQGGFNRPRNDGNNGGGSSWGGGNQGGNTGGSWGGGATQNSNTPAVPDVPSWGAPAQPATTEVPSWGQPEKKDEAPKPAEGWGAPPTDPAPVLPKTDTPNDVPGWGAPSKDDAPKPAETTPGGWGASPAQTESQPQGTQAGGSSWGQSGSTPGQSQGNSWGGGGSGYGGPRNNFNNDRPPRNNFGGDRPPRRDFGDRPPRNNFGGDRQFGQGGGFGGGSQSWGSQGGQTDGQGGFNRGERRFNDRPPRDNFNGGGYQSRGPRDNNGGSWGSGQGDRGGSGDQSWQSNAPQSGGWGAKIDGAAAVPDVPSWGAPEQKTSAPEAPSWGAPAETKPATTEAPSWGAPAEAKAAPTEAPSWGAPTTDNESKGNAEQARDQEKPKVEGDQAKAPQGQPLEGGEDSLPPEHSEHLAPKGNTQGQGAWGQPQGGGGYGRQGGNSYGGDRGGQGRGYGGQGGYNRFNTGPREDRQGGYNQQGDRRGGYGNRDQNGPRGGPEGWNRGGNGGGWGGQNQQNNGQSQGGSSWGNQSWNSNKNESNPEAPSWGQPSQDSTPAPSWGAAPTDQAPTAPANSWGADPNLEAKPGKRETHDFNQNDQPSNSFASKIVKESVVAKTNEVEEGEIQNPNQNKAAPEPAPSWG